MEKKSSFIKSEIWLWLLFALSIAVAVYVYPMMPDKIPTHWGINGEVNRYSTRFAGTFRIVFMNIGLYVLFLLLPRIDPKRANYKVFEGTYRYVRYLMHTSMFAMQSIMILAALGYAVNISMIVKLFVALVFIFLGNVMGRFRHNYFVGIKTPWTLASEEVWTKTHRMAAPIWVVGGIIGIINAFINGPISAFIMIAVIISMVLVPTVYSYVEYTKLAKRL